MQTRTFEPIIKTADSIEATKAQMYAEASGEQLGLYCRFNKVNIALNKYWRFGRVNVIAGRSGGGKSYFISQLRADFLAVKNYLHTGNTARHFYLGNDLIEDASFRYNERILHGDIYTDANVMQLPNGDILRYGINRNFVGKVLVVHFGSEMRPEDENIRTVANILGLSYNYVLSSEWQRDSLNYNQLTSEEMSAIEEILDTLADRKEIYVQVPMTIGDMDRVVRDTANSYPDHHIVVFIDHAHLILKYEGQTEEGIVEAIAATVHSWKTELFAMINVVMQMNKDIDGRTGNPKEHYPRDTDIYFVNRIKWAADNIMIVHIPEIIPGIVKYGPDKLNPEGLVHLPILKSRNGRIGDVWLRNDLSRGRFIQAERGDFN